MAHKSERIKENLLRKDGSIFIERLQPDLLTFLVHRYELSRSPGNHDFVNE
jgi:hypothetical protein